MFQYEIGAFFKDKEKHQFHLVGKTFYFFISDEFQYK